jgi:hypothetical protein
MVGNKLHKNYLINNIYWTLAIRLSNTENDICGAEATYPFLTLDCLQVLMGGECSVEVFCLFTFITALSLSSFFIFRWLIDYCLTSSDQYYLSYIQDDNNERRDGSTVSTTSVCQWTRMESWVKTKSLVVCSGYKTSTHFRNLERGL